MGELPAEWQDAIRAELRNQALAFFEEAVAGLGQQGDANLDVLKQASKEAILGAAQDFDGHVRLYKLG